MGAFTKEHFDYIIASIDYTFDKMAKHYEDEKNFCATEIERLLIEKKKSDEKLKKLKRKITISLIIIYGLLIAMMLYWGNVYFNYL